jgi:hypothetical protein
MIGFIGAPASDIQPDTREPAFRRIHKLIEAGEQPVFEKLHPAKAAQWQEQRSNLSMPRTAGNAHMSPIFKAGGARKVDFMIFSDTANFPKMISLRLGERMRQRLSRRRAEGVRPGIPP